jgi:hypothetical protein
MSNQHEFLNTLKEGDEVICRWGSYSTSYALQKVAKTTKTQVVLDNGSRFRKDDGREVGDRYNCIMETNEKNMAIIHRQAEQRRVAIKYRKITNTRLDLLSETALDAIQAIIDSELAFATLTEVN